MKNTTLAALVFVFLCIGIETGSAQSTAAPVITKTSTSYIAISATAGQCIQVYSMSPQIMPSQNTDNTIYAGWKLVTNGLVLVSPIVENQGGITVYSYSNIPSVIAGPATLYAIPGSASKLVTISYSIVPN
jgi:hypothetical protein